MLVVGVLTVAPAGARAADHRDAPITLANGLLDINDVYTFRSQANPNNTVIVVTVVPLAGVFNLPMFSPIGVYEIKVDNTGDAIEDLTFRFAFSNANRQGRQSVAVQMITPLGTHFIAQDLTGTMIPIAGGGTIMASLFDDPFFFDLNAFKAFEAALLAGQTSPPPSSAFHNPGTDFFKGLNTMAIVVEVPSVMLQATASNSMIGVWARTLDASGHQIDRMGRPAINTALIPPSPPSPTDEKTAFNQGIPSNDRARFTSDVMTMLALYKTTFPPSMGGLPGLVNVLLPDILTFNTSLPADTAHGFLNGRRLDDDVIDIEFGLLTINVGVTTDFVGNDSNFSLNKFPYLQSPNPVAGPR
jgi:hypothetical protein